MATIIRTGFVGVRETFGRFSGVSSPGLQFFIPFVQKVHKVNTQVNQVNLKLDSRTSDNVFSEIHVSVQYSVDPTNVEKAFYSLKNPLEQIVSKVEKSVRASTSKLSLKELFEDQDKISGETKEGLASILTDNGYKLRDVLITNVNPDAKVRDAMNDVSASARKREAAANEAEAVYIKLVKEAEAEKERKILQGFGIAGQRKAILEGLRDAITSTAAATGISSDMAAQIALRTQELDTYAQIGAHNNTKILFLGSSSGKTKNLISALETQV